VVLWLFGGPTSTKKEALRQLSDTSFYAEVDKDLTSANQQIVKRIDRLKPQTSKSLAKKKLIVTQSRKRN